MLGGKFNFTFLSKLFWIKTALVGMKFMSKLKLLRCNVMDRSAIKLPYYRHTIINLIHTPSNILRAPVSPGFPCPPPAS